jgi:glycosyltransferase involved in cell wall biosynthesis
MLVSVVICTRNRRELLRATLESLRSLIVPAGQRWELLVVDNHSSDGTDDVIAAYRDLLPLRPLFEPKIGLSRARNTAVRAAAGDLLLFTDDDVRIDPGWMTAYLEAGREWPDAGYFAGVIRPHFAAGVPAWVRRNQAALAGMLCLRDLGSAVRRLRRGEFPYGPNMALRREVLPARPFDERVGRKGDEQVRGGDSSLFLDLQRRKVQGVWVPRAKVDHVIPPCRADVEYLWSYYHGCGRAQVRLGVVCATYSRWRILGAALKEVAKSCVWWWVWARHVATVACLSGQLAELRQLAVRRHAVDEIEYSRERS